MLISVFLAAIGRACESQALTILSCSGNDTTCHFKYTFEILPLLFLKNATYVADLKYCEPP